jgi:hypothetical protein
MSPKLPDSIISKVQENVPYCSYHVNISLDGVRSAIEHYQIDLDPEYQRGYVWTREQSQRFVGALIEYPQGIPPLWFNFVSKDYDRSHAEVIDGKQRLTACLRWIDGEIEAICPCGISIRREDLNEVELRHAGFVFMSWNFVNLDSIEVMQFYLRLNCGGTVHESKDLERVRQAIDHAGPNNNGDIFAVPIEDFRLDSVSIVPDPPPGCEVRGVASRGLEKKDG